MGISGIIQGILATFTGRRIPAFDVDGSLEPHLPAADEPFDSSAIPRGLEPLRPGIRMGTSLEERTRDRRPNASGKHRRGTRPWSKVTGICLHQTACNLGENPPRWDTVGCHIGVTRNGQVIRLHDLNAIVIHGNGWNAQTVGIEIDGMYAGIEGDERTFWRPKGDTRSRPQHLTDETVEATCQVIRSICDEISANGGQLKVIVAHRQASVNRRNDPGSAIWQRIALPMISELGLHDGGSGFRIGDGYPIPEAWDASRRGIRY